MPRPTSPGASHHVEEAPLPLLLRTLPHKRFPLSQSDSKLKVKRDPAGKQVPATLLLDNLTDISRSPGSEKAPKTAWATTPVNGRAWSPQSGVLSPSSRPTTAATPEVRASTPPFLTVEAYARVSPVHLALSSSLVVDGGGTAEEYLTRHRAHAEGFTAAEMTRMRQAFRRFKPPDSTEVSRHELCNVLEHLGYVGVTRSSVERLALDVSAFLTLDFGDFTEFAERFAKYEQDGLHAAFKKHAAASRSRSGRVGGAKLQGLLRSLGVTALRSSVDEALRASGLAGATELSPEQFACFLAAYRASQGFNPEELASARLAFEATADVARVVPDGRPPSAVLPFLSKATTELRPQQLTNAATRFLGPFAAADARELEERFANSKEGLSLNEFLVCARRIREAMLCRLHGHFAEADSNGDGLISAAELVQPLGHLGMTLVASAIEEFLASARCTEPLDLDNFASFVAVCRETAGFTRSEVAELQEVFTRFDYDHSGGIDQVELLDMMRWLGHLTSLEEVHSMIKDVDINDDGVLDFGEFLRLMRVHREMELQGMRRAFDNCVEPGVGKCREDCLEQAVRALGWASACSESRLAAGGGECDEQVPALMSFDDFFAICIRRRRAFAAQRRKQAGFSEEEVEHLSELFRLHGGSEGSTISQGSLARLLTELGVPMSTAKEREVVFKAVKDARFTTKEVIAADEEPEQGDSPDLTLWSVLHLLRALACRSERQAVVRDIKAMEQIGFSHTDVAEFRSIFNRLLHEPREDEASDLSSDDIEPAEDREPGQTGEPLAALRAALAGDCPRISSQSVWHLLRSLGLRMRLQHRAELSTRAAAFASGGGEGAAFVRSEDESPMLHFAAFLHLVRWMLDSNFADINGTCARVAGSSAMPMQAALASAVATAMPGGGSDGEAAPGKKPAHGAGAGRHRPS